MRDSGNSATKILVVDRDHDSAQRMRTALLHEGFRCQSSSSAAAALTHARQQLPSLMIVDTHLDACSGFDLVENIKDNYPRHDIPVIYISDSQTGDMLAESRDAGGLYFLSKPIDPSVLLELVDKALWMPHLVRRHIDASAHPAVPKPSRVLTEKSAVRVRASR